MKYVLSLDAGTSSVRAALYDETGDPVPGAAAAVEHEPEMTPDGGVEMDAEALFQRALGCVEEVLLLAGKLARAIAGVGVSTFWHSILGVGADGAPVTPVLLWADTRSVAEVEALRRILDERSLHRRTGCLLHTSYIAPRLLWVRRHRTAWNAAAQRWMSPAEYLFLRLFGKPVCSVSMASGTGMYDQEAERWDPELLGAVSVAPEQLSPVVDTLEPCLGLAPEFARRLPALAEVPWFPAAGDGACSNAGSGCARPEQVALMVGTSGAIRVMRPATGVPNAGPGTGSGDRTGTELQPAWGLWKYRLDRRRYLLGGALSNGGNLLAWLRETLRAPEAEELERQLGAAEPDAHGLTILPFLAGERCPGWRGDARAAVVGLSWTSKPEEIVRAGLEAVAYRFALIHALLGDAAEPGHRIVASGRALLSSTVWTQMMADALGREVIASDVREASARGAALLALEGAGVIRDLADAPPRLGRLFQPDPGRHERYTQARKRQERLYEALIARDWRTY